MDLDRPLDDFIGDKRKTEKDTRRPPRQSRERAAPIPYSRPSPRSTEDTWVHDAYQGQANPRRAQNGGLGAIPVSNVAGTGVGFTGVSPRIEIVGLHYEVTPQDLKTIFSQAGTLVQGPTIRYDRSGRSRGEATMEFASYQQAKIAINKFDGAMAKGQTISIRLLPPATVRPGPGARGGAQSGALLLSRISGGIPPAAAVRGSPRGGPRGRGGPVRGRGGPTGRGGGRGPASSGNLDKELDSFMSSGTTANGDVEMA